MFHQVARFLRLSKSVRVDPPGNPPQERADGPRSRVRAGDEWAEPKEGRKRLVGAVKVPSKRYGGRSLRKRNQGTSCATVRPAGLRSPVLLYAVKFCDRNQPLEYSQGGNTCAIAYTRPVSRGLNHSLRKRLLSGSVVSRYIRMRRNILNPCRIDSPPPASGPTYASHSLPHHTVATAGNPRFRTVQECHTGTRAVVFQPQTPISDRDWCTIRYLLLLARTCHRLE